MPSPQNSAQVEDDGGLELGLRISAGKHEGVT